MEGIAEQQLAADTGKAGDASNSNKKRSAEVQEPRECKRLNIDKQAANLTQQLETRVHEIGAGKNQSLESVGSLKKEMERLNAETEAAQQQLMKLEGKTQELAAGKEAAERKVAVLLRTVEELRGVVGRLSAEKEAAKQQLVEGEAARRQLSIAEKIYERLQQLEKNTRVAERIEQAKRGLGLPVLKGVAKQQRNTDRPAVGGGIDKLDKVIQEVSHENVRLLSSQLLQKYPSLRNTGGLYLEYVKEKGMYEFL